MSIWSLIAADETLDPALRKVARLCLADMKAQSLAEFGPMAPCFRRFEAEPTPSERAADEYQDRRMLRDKERRFE